MLDYKTDTENAKRKNLKNGVARSSIAEKTGELIDQNFEGDIAAALTAANIVVLFAERVFNVLVG